MRERSRTILADGAPVAGFRSAWLAGRDVLELMFIPFIFWVWHA